MNTKGAQCCSSTVFPVSTLGIKVAVNLLSELQPVKMMCSLYFPGTDTAIRQSDVSFVKYAETILT
jgi:hypothetical protein